MKKKYQQPAVQLYEALAETIIALSIKDGNANSDTDVLVKGNDWDVFGSETESETD
ncbi:MAG: hypothetical protein J5545_09530 [Bacteroidaceae bacterium]|nr:hypothetical protein [Bacteroidaceae bacterium]